MGENRFVEARAEAVECALSLAKAVHDAGGSFASLDLNTMTVMEFITEVAAQNGIRFVYVKPVSVKPKLIKSGVDNFGCHLPGGMPDDCSDMGHSRGFKAELG